MTSKRVWALAVFADITTITASAIVLLPGEKVNLKALVEEKKTTKEIEEWMIEFGERLKEAEVPHVQWLNAAIKIPRQRVKTILRSGIIASHTDSEYAKVHIETLEDQIEDREREILRLHAELEQFEQEYDEYQSLFAPIRKLPSEILGLVFLYAVHEDFFGNKGHSMTITAPFLAGICLYWRTADDVVPGIKAVVEEQLQGLEGFLGYSKHAVLKFKLLLMGSPNGKLEECPAMRVLERLRKESPRLQHLTLTFSLGWTPSLANKVVKYIFNNPLPAMESLNLDLDYYDIPDIEADVPRLRSLAVGHKSGEARNSSFIHFDPSPVISLLPLPPFPLAQITCLHIQYKVHDAVNVLKQCPNLITAHLIIPASKNICRGESDCGSASEEDSGDEESLPRYPPRNPRPPLPIPPYQVFPRLESFTLEITGVDGLRFGAFCDVAQVLHAMTTPRLTSLAIISDAEETQTMVDARARYYDLPSFYVSLMCLLFRSEVLPSLRKLRFEGIPISEKDLVALLEQLTALEDLIVREPRRKKSDKDQDILRDIFSVKEDDGPFKNNIIVRHFMTRFKFPQATPRTQPKKKGKAKAKSKLQELEDEEEHPVLVPNLRNLHLTVHDDWTRGLFEAALESRRSTLKSVYIKFLYLSIKRIDFQRLKKIQDGGMAIRVLDRKDRELLGFDGSIREYELEDDDFEDEDGDE
ncbi:hypothetical protein VNI00_016283 [Paramarasmius palmivorus]|uniref:Uncharacterized protein n=1 Tax=Paramarasmius palmivorus TaxID=297713 RepID=A0AAW0BEH3_9AGAR